MATVKAETSDKAKREFKLNALKSGVTETYLINQLIDAFNGNQNQTLAVLKNLNK